MTGGASDLGRRVNRILARRPQEQELVRPIDQRQRDLTERFLLPVLPQLEAEFLAIRAEVDGSMREWLAEHSEDALPGGESYPKGYCLPITHQALRRFLRRGIEGPPSEAFLAILRLGEEGGHVGRIWGILRDRYFQNSLQLGSHYFDVANDTVDVRKPDSAIGRCSTFGFRNVESLADYVRIGESYWECTFFPNLHFPRLVPLYPLLQVRNQDGHFRLLRLSASMQWLNWRSDFDLAETFLRRAVEDRRPLPPEWFAKVEAFRRDRVNSAPSLPEVGFGEETLRRACGAARERYRRAADGERAFDEWTRSAVQVVIDEGRREQNRARSD